MCEVEKPLGQFRKLSRGTHAKLCITCERPPCYNCGKPYPAGAEPLNQNNQNKVHYFCSTSCKSNSRASDLQLCSMCEVQKPLGQFRKLKTHAKHAQICITCESPACYTCGKAYPAGAAAFKKNKTNKHYYCSESCKFPPCAFAGCQKERPKSLPQKYNFFKMPVWYCWEHSGQ